MDPQLFLIAIAAIAFLIIVSTIVAVIIILRRPDPNQATSQRGNRPSDGIGSGEVNTPSGPGGEAMTAEDPAAYLLQQRDSLIEFELKDISNNFKGITQDAQRRGLITHLTNPDVALIAFVSEIYNPTSASIKAETVYGSMELIITQGKAGMRWEGQPLGVLDYTNQRILGDSGQLLGSMERPSPESGTRVESYPVGFFGQPVAEVLTTISASSTLRWFDDQDTEPTPIFSNLANELDDEQTLLLLGIVVLEFGYFSVL